MQMRHGRLIILVIYWPQVKVGFQGSECIFYFPDCIVNVPNNNLIGYFHIGTKKINAQAFYFIIIFCLVFFPAHICCPMCFFICSYFNYVILSDRKGIFLLLSLFFGGLCPIA